MANSVSYEYLKAIQGVPGGIPTLDNNGEIPTGQLPDSAASPFKGEYATEAALLLAYPTANLADYAYVDETTSFWYWNAGLLDGIGDPAPAWVNQEIEETPYNLLDAAEKSMVPYLVIADPVTP